MSSPGMAAEDPLYGEVAAFDRAIFSNSLDTILAAGRGIAAGAWQVW